MRFLLLLFINFIKCDRKCSIKFDMDLGILIDANSTEKNFLNQKYLAREILKWVPDIGQV